MKLATFQRGDHDETGIVVEDRIVPISNILPGAPQGMIELITVWDSLSGTLNDGLAQSPSLPLDVVTLRAPVLSPAHILAIGLNYADHIAESGLKTPEHQLWFAKLPGTINGPYDPVQIPKASPQIDYEGELVIVIGKGGRHISRERAHEHVFGYCVGNDVSVRDWQTRTTQWMLGKSFDTHGPIGPWITTADEVGDPHRLALRTIVNGEVRQESNTRHLVFDVWDQIAHLSEAITLRPGDILFSGTPGGVGLAMQPPRFLKAGDVVTCEIEELGAITATFEAE